MKQYTIGDLPQDVRDRIVLKLSLLPYHLLGEKSGCTVLENGGLHFPDNFDPEKAADLMHALMTKQLPAPTAQDVKDCISKELNGINAKDLGWV